MNGRIEINRVTARVMGGSYPSEGRGRARTRPVMEFFTTSATNLVDAASRAGVDVRAGVADSPGWCSYVI